MTVPICFFKKGIFYKILGRDTETESGDMKRYVMLSHRDVMKWTFIATTFYYWYIIPIVNEQVICFTTNNHETYIYNTDIYPRDLTFNRSNKNAEPTFWEDN